MSEEFKVGDKVIDLLPSNSEIFTIKDIEPLEMDDGTIIEVATLQCTISRWVKDIKHFRRSK